MKLNIKLLVFTILAGFIGFIADLLLYNSLVGHVAPFVLTAIMLAVLAVFVIPTIFIFSNVTEETQEEFMFLNGNTAIIIALVVALVVLFLAAMGLEAIYGAESVDTSVPTSYIFVLDESGSMYGNDPNMERYNAVNTMMSTVDPSTPYAVYVFGTEAACAKAMAPYSQGGYVADTTLNESVGGGTAIKRALDTVLNDYHGGSFVTGGNLIRVVLLSDGASGDMGLFSSGDILASYRDAGVSISTVGLGQDDRSLMKQIAKKTGGTYIHIDGAQDLAQGFNVAATTSADRDLFSQRNIVFSEFLYAVLRILFLTILGAIVAFMKAAAWANYDSQWLIIVEGCIASFVGALAVELLALAGVTVGIGLAIYCIAVAATPAEKTVVVGSYENYQLNTYY